MPTGGDRQAEHTKLKTEILLDLGGRGNVMVENTPNGLFRSVRGSRVVRIGAPGMPDIRGLVHVLQSRHTPRFAVALAVEVKTGRGTLRKNQQKWRSRFISCGGLYILARRVEDVHIVIGPPGSVFSVTQFEEAINAQSPSDP